MVDDHTNANSARAAAVGAALLVPFRHGVAQTARNGFTG
jgi:hypothetical protein